MYFKFLEVGLFEVLLNNRDRVHGQVLAFDARKNDK